MLRALTLAAAFLASASFAQAGDRPPNIVYILADDLGWTDLGCQGSKYYETPHIDRLAAQGMRLTAYHNCQNCTPTRAAVMGGQYPPRTGIYTVGSLERGLAKDRKLIVPANETKLPLDRNTIADQMKAAGYATAIFGKWHIGEVGDHHPGKRGFDEALVTMGKHFGFATNPKVDVPKGVYLADWLTEKATGFIERNQSRPFFLYLAHFGVHSPYDAKPAYIERFRKKAGVGGHNDPVYAAMIASVDDSVGAVLAKLDALGLAKDTIVIFSSDNGGVGGYGDVKRGVTTNLPLRGGKGQLYAGGLRVPFVVRWPGKTPPGQTNDVPAVHVDLFPTFLEVAKAPRPKQTLDGESLVPLWTNPSGKLARDAIFFHMPGYLEGGAGWRTTPASAIQMGDWKLIEFFETGKKEVYNLREDLGESKNLAESNAAKTKELHDRLVAWRTSVNAPIPRLRTAADPPGVDAVKGKKKNKKGE